MPVYTHPNRTILNIYGPDRISFLQGLVSNDMRKLESGPVYAGFLSPQGKYLADFILVPQGEGVLLDVDSTLAPAFVRRLSMYKLRANVTIEETDLRVSQIWNEDAPDGAVPDPRATTLGQRYYGEALTSTATSDDWTALRIAHLVPESGIELKPDDSYLLEMGFEGLNGVDFRKGCYVGQEVTARMKHKTELRKGLAQVRLSAPVDTGAEITADGKPAGEVLSVSGDLALAYLRFDRATGVMQAGDADVTLIKRAV